VESQAWHWPVHALSQHTPSTQFPPGHRLAVVVVQAVPNGKWQVPS
jgi:hypothetical protein